MRKTENADYLAGKNGAVSQRDNLLIDISRIEMDADFLPAWAK